MTDIQLQEPPHDFDLERALLGALMMRAAAWERINSGALRRDDFADPDHRALFAAIGERRDRGEAAGVLDLKAFADAKLQASGGAKVLAKLAAESWKVSDAGVAAAALRRLSQRRSLLRIAEDARAAAFDEGVVDVDRRLQTLAGAIDTIAQAGDPAGGFVQLNTIIDHALAAAERAYQGGGNLAGLPTGFGTVDWYRGGLKGSDLVILAGRPSMGKTTLATDIALNVAAMPQPVGFIS